MLSSGHVEGEHGSDDRVQVMFVIRADVEAMLGRLKQLKKKYKEVIESLRWSGACVDSDDKFVESGIYVNFKSFRDS